MGIRVHCILLLAFLCSCSNNKSFQSDAQSLNGYDGVWAEDEDANALFTIKGDSIVNFEHGDRMRFKIIGDSMIIDYGDFVGRHLILKHTHDSLILKNEDNSVTKLYKR
jgi:hypothetical protein